MKWIKHDTDANQDNKLQNVLLDYGLEGYGLYWYCMELIGGNVSVDNITFELEHDARIIARNVGSTPQKVEQMMTYFVEIGLFENDGGNISCFSMARRIDKSMTSNPQMRKIIDGVKQVIESKGGINKFDGDEIMTQSCLNHDSIMTQSCNSHDRVMQDKIRLDKNIKANVPDKSETCPHQKIIDLYHEKLPMLTRVKVWSDARRSKLKTRWCEDKNRQTLEYWSGLFEFISKSDFLTGKSSEWKADLEWIVSPKNFIKIIEGNYENK